LIKINLVREGRAVRGAGAAPVTAAAAAPAGGSNINNILIVGLLVVGALIAGGYWWWEKRERDRTLEIVAERQVQATKLEAIIKEVDAYQKRKDNLQERINLINQLKQNQKGPVRIMDQISRDLPDLVWLDQMTITGQNVTLDGRGLNPNAIANFIENIKRNPYFEEPTVSAVSQVSTSPLVYGFDMSFTFTYTPKGTAAAADAAATSTTGTTAATATQ
jgi:type IV pilus assembly protein PilN